MAELQYKLMTSAVNNFDCGNPAINEYVENSYFATLLQQCYAYEIEYKSLVVGYYMITFRDVAFYDCISEISDYQIDDFGEFLPSLNKIGTKTLEKIINEARQWTDFLPIRFITLNAVPEKVDWYKKMGFKEMGKNIDAVNTYMYIDLIKDSQYVKNYFEQQTADLLGY